MNREVRKARAISKANVLETLKDQHRNSEEKRHPTPDAMKNRPGVRAKEDIPSVKESTTEKSTSNSRDRGATEIIKDSRLYK